ncbi:jg228 [Pararge aegeria aegeria]|uniref:Jg228 protein n=1 Tax=Pararge aegeria aegeria TaxID=348720 RepID=A0A8S4S639_9NEOP|nr:jg228 [Pararge aegeria aegeria]
MRVAFDPRVTWRAREKSCGGLGRHVGAPLVELSVGELERVQVQSSELTVLVGAAAAVPVRAAARVALVHVLLAGDALEERVLDHWEPMIDDELMMTAVLENLKLRKKVLTTH